MNLRLIETSNDLNRAAVVGLVFGCPVSGDPVDCDLHAVRELPVRERLAWVKSLTLAECAAIQTAHADCLRRREAVFPAGPSSEISAVPRIFAPPNVAF